MFSIVLRNAVLCGEKIKYPDPYLLKEYRTQMNQSNFLAGTVIHFIYLAPRIVFKEEYSQFDY